MARSLQGRLLEVQILHKEPLSVWAYSKLSVRGWDRSALLLDDVDAVAGGSRYRAGTGGRFAANPADEPACDLARPPYRYKANTHE